MNGSDARIREMNDFEPKIMNHGRAAFYARYLMALRGHLDRKGASQRNRAQNFGRAILAGGMGARDLALMHERAMAALASSPDGMRNPRGARKRAEVFLSETLVPFEVDQR